MNLLAITPSIGPGELLVILLILVLLFGAKRLPELGQSFGKTIKGFRKGMDDLEDEDNDEDASTSERSQNGSATRDSE